jgi:hypothetical protein
VDVHRPVVTLDDGPLVPVVSRSGAAPGGDLSPESNPDHTNGTVYRPPRLARRKPGAKLPKDLPGEPPPVHTGTDEVLLKRIRTALRALR